MFYCLQALVVPSGSNGGFNAQWNREGGIERRGQRMKEKRETENTNMNDFTCLACYFLVSYNVFC